MMFKRGILKSVLPFVFLFSFVGAAKAQFWITGADSYNIIEDYPGAVFDVKSNDINLTFETDIYLEISVAPLHGLAIVDDVNDWILYTPDANYAGSDVFEYTICANTDPPSCATANVSVDIDSVDDAPIAIDDHINTYINIPVNIELLLNDIDIDGQGVEFEIIDDAFPGTTTILPLFPLTGEYIYYEPAPDWIGSDTIIYKVCKTGSDVYCDTGAIYVNVLSTNFNKPNAVNDTFNIYVNVVSDFNVLLNDFDGDADGLFVTDIIIGGADGDIAISATNTITYSANFVGTDDFAYVVCDDNIPSLCDTAFVHVNITESTIVDVPVYVPNSFSPNGDGINDELYIEGIQNFPKYNLKIFDRWSSLVFETENDVKMWNGKSNVTFISATGDVPEGTYFYILRLDAIPDPLTGFIVLKR